MTDIDRLIEELVRRLRGRPILEIVTAARQIENRVGDLYLHEALRKYAADRREEPSRHVVAALRRLLGHDAPLSWPSWPGLTRRWVAPPAGRALTRSAPCLICPLG